MKNNYFVYIHIRPDTETVFYVGIGSHQRKWKHRRAYTKASRNIHWRRIVDKCNGEFVVKILQDNIYKEEAVAQECKLISEYGRSDLKAGTLCNMTAGGEGVAELSVESKVKISVAMTGENNPQFGKMRSDEWKTHMCQLHTGSGNPNYGKSISK